MPILSSPRVVLLIDADNVQPPYFRETLDLSSPYGSLTICRAYGDWTKQPLSASADRTRIRDIEYVQVDRVNKNATDRKLKQDATEILRLGNADIFIIASCDGDFTTLCVRIKHSHRQVIVIGIEGYVSKRLLKVCGSSLHYIRATDKQG